MNLYVKWRFNVNSMFSHEKKLIEHYSRMASTIPKQVSHIWREKKNLIQKGIGNILTNDDFIATVKKLIR